MKTLAIIFMFISLTCFGQRWQDSNKGLHLNALQATVNPRNTAIGLRYLHLFEKDFYGVPVGLYGSFSNTIHPDTRFVNYDWERKYAFGGIITLPYSYDMHGIYTFISLGAVYNQHPRLLADRSLYKGQFAGNYYETCKYGVDLGVTVKIKHFTTGVLIDVINFFRYSEIGIGYCF